MIDETVRDETVGDDDSRAEAGGAEAPDRPVLRVVRGDPTPEELAAVTVVAAAAASGGSGGTEPDPGPRSVWAQRSRLVRRPPHPGPGAWRASALPG